MKTQQNLFNFSKEKDQNDIQDNSKATSWIDQLAFELLVTECLLGEDKVKELLLDSVFARKMPHAGGTHA